MGKVLHASYSGYFPSCIGEERTQGVLDGTLNDLMYIYWRVKTWEIESVIGELILGDGVTTWTFNQGVTPLGSINANTEEELVCGKTFVGASQIPFATSSGSAAGDLGIVYNSSASKNSNDLYQIFFYMIFEVAGGRIFSTNIQTPQGSQLGLLTLKPINITTPIYGSGSITGTMNISVGATEWWSYGGTYNTQTGEPL